VTAVQYEVAGHVAHLTLNRPERGNGLNGELITELERSVERADLDPAVRVLLLAGNGKGFCGGYDLVESAEGRGSLGVGGSESVVPGSPLDRSVMVANHDPDSTWDPMVDYAMMSRNVRAFMSLFHCSKPVVCKVHGFCVAGGTDMALCSDLLVIAADARIGYPPARVWGSPTTSMWAYRLGPQRAKRLLFTGDSLSGTEALEWGLAIDAPAAAALDAQRHNGAAIPFRLLWDHYMLAEGSINSAPPMQFFVDTGLAGAAFTAPQSTLDAAGISFPADKSGYQPFTAKTLTLGSVTQHDLLGLSGVFPPSLETALGARVGGLISHAFFKPYAVTFDFSAMQIYLVPASSAPTTS